MLEPLEETLAADAGDDLEDLDALLVGAVEAAEARKAKRRTTHPELDELLAAATPQRTWQPEYSIAHFVEQTCQCGAVHRRFDGWFTYSTHLRDPSASRLTRAPDHCELPSWQYVTQQTALYCTDCVAADELPLVSQDLLPGIDALGTPCACCATAEAEQLMLDLRGLYPHTTDEGEDECE